MKAGTSNAPNYVPVLEIRMLLYIDLVDTLLSFHAITECDSVSQFSGHDKKTTWAVFKQHYTDLIGLGHGSLSNCKHCSINREIHLQDIRRARG